jgi:phosphatidate cytidylyltransferase
MAPRAPETRPGSGGVATRIASGLVLAVPTLAAVYLGSPYVDVMVALAAVILAWEWCRMCDGRGRRHPFVITAAAIVVAVAALPWIGPTGAMAMLVAAAVAMHAVTQGRSWLSAGVLYLGLPGIAFLWLRSDPIHGRDTILWLLAVVWASDIGAYAIGRWIGGPKLAPSVSPGKTWAGTMGGLTCAAGAACAVAVALGATSVWGAATAGVVLGAVAQGGDLVESWVKRRFGVKDSGGLIPGHGGLLDRVDALMTATVGLAFGLAVAGPGIRGWT